MLRKLTISSLASLAAPLAAAVSAFFATPVLLQALGAEDYGLWVVCASVAAYAGLLDLGMAGAATRFLAGALSQEDASRRAGLLLAFRRFYRLVGAALLALGFVLAAVSHWPEAGGSMARGLLVVGILVASSGLGFLFRVNSAILRANLEYQAIAFAAVVRTAVYTAVVLLASARLDLLQLAWLFAALTLAEQILVWAQARRLLPPRSELRGVEHAAFRPLFGHAGKSTVGSVAAALRWKADTQIIAGFVSLPAVTQYSVGMKLPQLFFDLLSTLFGSQFVAAFAQWRAKNPEGDPRPMVALGIKACAIVSFSGACVLFFVIPPFLERWLGPGYDEAKQLARILLPFWAFMALPIPLSQMLVAEGRHGRIAVLSITGATANVVLSLAFVLPFGAKGVVIATACEMLALIFAYAYWIAPKLKWNPRSFFLRLIAYPYLRFGLLAFPACALIANRTLAPTYPDIVGGTMLLAITCLALAIITLTNAQDRRMILSWAKNRRIR